MADKQFTSKMIMAATIVVAVVLILVIWPLSMMGKGAVSSGSGDDAEARILPVVRVEMQKAVVKSDGKFFMTSKEIKVTMGGCGG